VRRALILLLLAALLPLGACGRKGELEEPPGAQLPQPVAGPAAPPVPPLPPDLPPPEELGPDWSEREGFRR
jgi:predicted small lipoprotein YifL